MIIAEQKPLAEIRQLIAPYRNVLIIGCGTCMTVCDAGGESEVSFLHDALRVMQARGGEEEHVFTEYTVKRQCDPEFIAALTEHVDETDAILSLGCGIGVQTIAEYFMDIPVLPGVNTAFMGAAREMGVWDERCGACGDCRLDETGGICPVTRCTKGILNGPCAGTKNGKCEANQDMDCAWIQIYQRLERLGQLEKMRRYYAPRNYLAVARPKRITKKVMIVAGEENG